MSDNLKQDAQTRPRLLSRLFVPILAGATLRDRAIGCLGALIAIGLTSLVIRLILGAGPDLPLMVGATGASAVLLFAVPASPLAQPWPVIGGSTISAFVGYLVAQFVPEQAVAAGAAVAFAILAMSLTRSLHPPGGATALTAVIGGPAVVKWGALFPLIPVALNACILVAIGILFHRLSRRRYPHTVASESGNSHGTVDRPPLLRAGFGRDDIDAALAKLDETFDIDSSDIERLLKEVELQALIRANGDLSCADIMSRDVVSIRPETTSQEAVSLLLQHNVRVLPVTDRDGHLMGAIGLRELVQAGERLPEKLSSPPTASPAAPAVGLLPILSGGQAHAVIIVDAEQRVIGLISQSDLLSALARMPSDRRIFQRTTCESDCQSRSLRAVS